MSIINCSGSIDFKSISSMIYPRTVNGSASGNPGGYPALWENSNSRAVATLSAASSQSSVEYSASEFMGDCDGFDSPSAFCVGCEELVGFFITLGTVKCEFSLPLNCFLWRCQNS